MSVNVGEYVTTEYVDDDSSDYVSSIEGNTPFPSLTLSKKFELERYIHQGQIVSRFSNENICKPSSLKDLQQIESVNKESVSKESANNESVKVESVNKNIGSSLRLDSPLEKNGCCLLI